MSEELLKELTRILEMSDDEHVMTAEGEEPITLLDLDPGDIALTICEELRKKGYRVVKQEHVGYAVELGSFVYLGSAEAIGNHGFAPTPERRVWRDLP